MAIIYALISRKEVVLCEYTDAQGNFAPITRVVLRKIANSDTPLPNRSTFAYDNHHFHFLLDNELIYICMTDDDTKTTVAFAMLEEVKRQFQAKYGNQGTTAIAYAMNEFSRDLKAAIAKYENTAVLDQFDEVHGKMTSVKNVMVENINKVLERGEKLDLLVDKTNNLQHEAFKFEDSATKLKRAMWWKNQRLLAAILLLVVILIWLAASLICGFTFDACSASNTGQMIGNAPFMRGVASRSSRPSSSSN